MKYRELGNSGMKASVIAIGTWVTGGGRGWGEDPDDSESIRAIQSALDRGINLIDTAPVYGYGRSERVVGEAIRDRRDQVILATKCGLWWDDERGSFFTEFDGKNLRRSLRPDTIRIEIEKSLMRLKTDHIDLYQTHWQSVKPEKTPISETMGCLMDLKTEGKIRAIGISNVSLKELKEYISYGDLAANQPRYSMLCRGIEGEILPWCVEHNVATLAYMPLEQGLLTGKVGLDRTFGADEIRSDYSWSPWFKTGNRSRILDLLNGWSYLLDKYNCTLAQLVLAWTVSQPGITHALVGARRVSQVDENAAASEVDLKSDDVQQMTRDLEALGKPV
jgi:methylglyoxal reductase